MAAASHLLQARVETRTAFGLRPLIGHDVLCLGGRCDGYAEMWDGSRAVLEVKNRIYRLRGSVPLHEQVQVHVYMYVFGLPDAFLVEQHGASAYVHRIRFDQQLWQEVSYRLQDAQPEIQARLMNQ